MKLTFLGTGTSQGIPLIGCDCHVCISSDTHDKRLRTSAMISHLGKNIVIDTGPDFRQQMLREKVRDLDAVLFTHEHKDHIAGLDDIRAFNFLHKKKMEIYAVPRVQEAIRREFAYIFSERKYPGIPDINLNTIEDNVFSIGEVTVQPIPVMHLRLPVLGFKVEGLTYITDANFIDDKEMEIIKGTKVLVLNALRREKHVSHFNLEEALSIVEKVKPGITYFTHISHQLGRHEEVQKELPEGVFLAYDGLSVEI